MGKSESEKQKEKLVIGDFESIKRVFLLFYIYGCYSKDDTMAMFDNVGKEKYSKEIRRLEIMYGEDFFKNDKVVKRKRPNFSYDRYYNQANYLIKSYKIKTYTDSQISDYFYILQVLNSFDNKETLDTIFSKIDELIQLELEGETYCKSGNIQRRLETLRDIGFVDIFEDGKKKYSLTENILDELNEDEIQTLIQTLYFFRGVSPLTSQAIFTIETLKEFAEFSDFKINSEDVYFFKNNHLNNILNDNDIYNIITAINNSLILTLTINDKKDTDEKTQKAKKVDAVPFKIFTEHKHGRQYLFYFDLNNNKPTNIIIDDISCKITENKFDINDYKSCLDLIEKSYSMTQLYDLENPLDAKPILVEVDFKFDDEKTCKKIRGTVLKSKRQGYVTDVTNTQFLYSIEVLSPTEMIPYIRSFGNYASVRKSDKHDLYFKINEDWSNLKNAYGITK